MPHCSPLISSVVAGSLLLAAGWFEGAHRAAQADTVWHLAEAQSVEALARHLSKIGAKMYGAYWCPHCQHQKTLFGAAIGRIRYIECDPQGDNAQPQLCQAAKIQGYPTWEINGKLYPGSQSLETLANLSGYKGPRRF